MIYREHPKHDDIFWLIKPIDICISIIQMKDLVKDLLDYDTSYRPLLALLITKYDIENDESPYPRTQKELYNALEVSPAKFASMYKKLRWAFYFRLQGNLPSKDNPNELVDTNKYLKTRDTYVRIHFMYLGLYQTFPIRLQYIPRIGETINNHLIPFFPFRQGVVEGIVHLFEEGNHIIELYVNPDEDRQFNYFAWQQKNECPKDTWDRFQAKIK